MRWAFPRKQRKKLVTKLRTDKIKIKDLKGKKQTNRNYIGIVYYRKKKIE